MKKLSIVNKIGYGIGDFANGLTFGMSAIFLLAFYTDVLGITAAAAGILFLIARVWDAVNDPVMGVFTDRMFARRIQRLSRRAVRMDKFRPYLLTGSWPVVLSAVLLFVIPRGMNMTERLIWAYATYITWGMAYTFVNIPYGSLAAVMTRDPTERSILSVSRGIGGFISNVVVRTFVPIFLVQFSENQARGYLLAMILMALLAFVSYLLSYFTVKETVKTKEELPTTFHLVRSLRVIMRNRPFLAIALASVAILTGLLIHGNMAVYFFRENLNALNMLSLTVVFQVVPIILVAPSVPIIIKKLGSKRTAWISSLASAVAYLILLIIPSGIIVYFIVATLATIFLTLPLLLTWGMVSDCIDYNQYLSGLRQEGAIYGTYSFVRKMGQAIAGFFAGIGLSIIGYSAHAEVQTDGTLFGIKFISFGIPAIAMFIAFLAYYFIWDLTPQRMLEITQIISDRDSVTSMEEISGGDKEKNDE